LHLLDLRNEDFEQELELQSLKGQVTDPFSSFRTFSWSAGLPSQTQPISIHFCTENIVIYCNQPIIVYWTFIQQISQLIRHNQALEKDLDAMDIKIGLLIKNRIDLDEVMAHNKLLLSRLI